MRRLVDLVKLERLDSLIRRKATGKPEELAEKLEMSRSSLFELLAYLKNEMQAPIIYDSAKPSYVYQYPPKFHIGFKEDCLGTSELQNSAGGVDENEKRLDMTQDKKTVENNLKSILNG